MFLVAQLGARMHYAVPRILASAGNLTSFHTDITATHGWAAALVSVVPRKFQPSALKGLAGRVPEGVPRVLIKDYPMAGLRWHLALQRAGEKDRTALYMRIGKEFCQLILNSDGLKAVRAVYGFSTASLELLEEAKRRGIRTYLEQPIAPKRVEAEILREELKAFSPSQAARYENLSWERFAEREEAEWKLADKVICPSPFVSEAVERIGGASDKVLVVSYGVDWRISEQPTPPARGRLRVLFVGEVGLRKGAHYLLEAARGLSKIRFTLAGRITLPQYLLQRLPGNVELLGPVPRTEVKDLYSRSHLFCLPSLCEGSATVTYEALASGLPVITTANAGSVVRDGVDGYTVPIRDAVALRERIEHLASNEPLRAGMAEAAQARARDFTLERYRDRLLQALEVNP